MVESDLIITVLSSSLLGSIFGALISQWYNIKTQKDMRVFHQKEERFFNIMTDIGGFRPQKKDLDKQEKFYESYRHLWLYAKDETITKMNEFMFGTGARKLTYTELDPAVKAECEMILQIRKEFFGKTELKPENFQVVFYRNSATPQ